MNTCGTCKYRGVDKEDTVDVQPDMYFDGVYRHKRTNEPLEMVGTLVKPLKVFFLCGRIKHKVDLEDHEAVAEHAITIDGSGYYAALCVDDDFGCNQWEAANYVKMPGAAGHYVSTPDASDCKVTGDIDCVVVLKELP
jgi:hypothetical protein